MTSQVSREYPIYLEERRRVTFHLSLYLSPAIDIHTVDNTATTSDKSANMVDYRVESPDALLADQENSGYARSPNSKGLHEERIKHKAVRPSARLARMNLIADVMTDGDTLAVATKGPNGLKKYAKNSRRPRGRYGRGLPKKGTYCADWS